MIAREKQGCQDETYGTAYGMALAEIGMIRRLIIEEPRTWRFSDMYRAQLRHSRNSMATHSLCASPGYSPQLSGSSFRTPSSHRELQIRASRSNSSSDEQRR